MRIPSVRRILVIGLRMHQQSSSRCPALNSSVVGIHHLGTVFIESSSSFIGRRCPLLSSTVPFIFICQVPSLSRGWRVVDGRRLMSLPRRMQAAEQHAINTSLEVPSQSNQTHGMRIFYRTAWEQAWLHGSLSGGPWQDYPLKKVRS